MSRKANLVEDECRNCGGGGDLPHPSGDPQDTTYCHCPAGQRLRAEDRRHRR